MQVFTPSRLFTDDEIVEGFSVVVKDGHIFDVTRTSNLEDSFAANAVKVDGLLAPGFIDIQVNGGGGVLFNDAPTSETLKVIAAAHRAFGVTGVMATLISDDRAKVAKAIAAVGEAHRNCETGILGLHLEGPWLSDPKRGVHPSRHLRRFDAEDLQLIAQARAFPVMVTVAPEQIDVGAIRALRAAGVTVCLGHTAAPIEEIEAALAAGATGFTHLFNAMPPLEGRKPGAVGAALAHRETWAGIILDGIHVHPVTAKAAFAAKTERKLILVSDAMSTIGAKTSSMSLFGETISVSEGVLRTASGTLAGAHLELSGAVRNAVAMLGAATREALRMASATPAEFLGVDAQRGRIAAGARADFVLLGDTLDVKGVWVGGQPAA